MTDKDILIKGQNLTVTNHNHLTIVKRLTLTYK